jgi:hypothetical protein
VIDECSGFWSKLYHKGWTNVPKYSSSENITVAFFRVAYSDSSQRMVVATSAKACGARGWKYWGVVGWHPKLLAVKYNWWQMRSSTSTRVNHDFLSSTTLERYASSNWSSITWIRSSVSERQSNWQLWRTVRPAPSANHPRMVLILSFSYVTFGA